MRHRAGRRSLVNGVARRHHVNPNMLFGWRKQYREALPCMAPSSTPIGFAPVAISGPEPSEQPPSAPAGLPLIELEIGRSVRLRISGTVDPDLVAAVMKALPQR
jgi:transposase-like protein